MKRTYNTSCSYRTCFHLSRSTFPFPFPHPPFPRPFPCPGPPGPPPIPPGPQRGSCSSFHLHANHIIVNAPTIARLSMTYLRTCFRFTARPLVCEGSSGCEESGELERREDMEGVPGRFSGARRSTILARRPSY